MAEKPPIQVTSVEWQLIRSILQTHIPNETVWAFGSRAKNTAKPYSDLDIAILSKHALNLEKIAEIKEAFQESDLPYKVDIVDWARTAPNFQSIIAKEKIILQ